MIRIHFNIESIVTEQSLVDDSVSYQIVGSSMGVPLSIPVPVTFIERLDQSLQGEQPEPRMPKQERDLPVGYDIGIVDDSMQFTHALESSDE